jgi:molybdopterin/thiamine biosynthesis adenylyltransferase
VDFSNLSRQTLYTYQDAEKALPKAEAARRRLNEIMPTCQVIPRIADLTCDTADLLLHGAQVIADGTDNLATRYLINDWCILTGVPWVYAGAVGTEASNFPIVGRGGCFRCIFPDPPDAGSLPTCDTIGVLAAATAVAAARSSALVMRILLDDIPEPVWETRDVWRGTYAGMSVENLRSAHGEKPCPLCRDGITEFLDSEAGAPAVALCGRDMVQVRIGRAVDLAALEKAIGGSIEIDNNGYLLRFEADGHTIHVFGDGRALVKGTRDLASARSLVDRWIGT